MSRVAPRIRVVGMRKTPALEAPATRTALPPGVAWTRTLASGAALLALLLVNPPAQASDGVIEINQAKALAGGVTPGDAPGFPVTLSQEGSYRLTGNLVVAGPSTAIAITTWNVSLDLGGFSVSGPNVCTGYPTTSCNVEDGEPGIWANSDSHHVRVENGVVRSFNGRGVYLQGASSTAEDLRVLGNGGVGIYLNGAGRVIDCISIVNRRAGIGIPNDGLVESSETRANGYHGIDVGNGSRVSRSMSLSNAGNGINLYGAGYAEKNQANGNGQNGIEFNGTYGLAIENRAVGNTYWGIVGGGSLLSRNVGQQNAEGQVGAGVSLGDNLCGATLC